MKKIAVNIPEYIKSVVDLEDRILWASSETVVIPKMDYPKSTLKQSPGLLNFFKSEINKITP